MAYLSLYRKYRPQTFDDILGQEHVSRTLANAIHEGRVTHAYLFTGPRGTGKTSTARILAKALNCERGPTPSPCGECESCRAITEGSSLDVIELDAASHSSVDSTREILAGVPLAAAGGRRKVYVIDEVHMLTPQSFNALLKTLEEPPEHVVFVLATTEAHKVLPTIVSRTQRFDFRRVPVDALEDHLGRIAKIEEIDVTTEALSLVARHADGSVRDALSVLDQLGGMEGTVDAGEVERLLGGRSEDDAAGIFDAIAAHDVGAVLAGIDRLVAQGADMRQVALGMLEHARSLLFLRTAPDSHDLLDAAPGDVGRMQVQAEAFTQGRLLRVLELLSKALGEMRNAPAHRLLLEVALVRAADPMTDPGPAALVSRIERLERRIGIEGAPPTAEPVVVPPATVPTPAPGPRSAARTTPRPRGSKKSPPARAAAEPAAVPSTGTTPDDAPSTTSEPAPPVPASTSAEHVGFNHVRDAWTATLKEVSDRSKRVWGLLSPSRPLRLDGDVLVVEVQSDFHRETMAQAAHHDVLADALHGALGIRPRVMFEARGESRADPPPAVSGPDEHLAELAEATSVDETVADPVELVKKGLGAEVVEERSSE